MGNTSIYYSSNPADWTDLEGVYINRKKPEAQVVGADVNTPGLAGACVRGPLVATLVTSPAHFLQLYGGRDYGGGGAIKGEVWKALMGRKWSWPLAVCRAAAAAAAAAAGNLVDGGTTIAVGTASSKGAWANNASGTGVSLAVVNATDGDATHWDCLVKYLGDTVQRIYNIDTTAGHDNTSTVVGNDPGNLIVLTKSADGRPDNTATDADVNLAGGSDGTIAASDYVTALDRVARFSKSKVIAVCENGVTQATVNGEVLTLAAELPMKQFCVWGGVYAAPATDITTKDSQITTDLSNVIYCGNLSARYDQAADATTEGGCHLDMASILSVTPPEIHPGDEDNLANMASVRSLHNESLERGDLIALRAAGICWLEKVDKGFKFHSGVATDGSEITDIRTEQFLTESIAEAVSHDVTKPFTTNRQIDMTGKIIAFLKELRAADRIVDNDSKDLGPAWDIRFVQSDTERSRNIGRLRTAIRILPHLNHLVLETDISTGTTVVVQQ